MKRLTKKTGFFKSFDGTPIYYEVRGEGKPLVFAYGIACVINHWRHQIKYFSQNYQTIVFDYRGHHNSGTPKDRENLNMDALAQDLKCLMDHLKIKKATFLGHSFGSPVIIRAFDLYPEMFENLVMVNGFATNPIKGMFGMDLASTAFDLFRQGYDQLPETLSYVWKSVVTNPFAAKFLAMAGGFNLHLTSLKDVEIYIRAVANIDTDIFITLFGHMMNYDGKSVLDRLEVPTLIIGGEKDTVTPLKYQEVLHKRIKGSELLVVPYGSHCTQLDMPDLVNLRIEKFLLSQGY